MVSQNFSTDITINKNMNKIFWLNLAEIIDSYRVVPRLILVLTMIGYCWFTLDTYEWIKSIYETTNTIPTAVAAYAGGTISALGGVLTLVINKYFSGGRDWSQKNNQ